MSEGAEGTLSERMRHGSRAEHTAAERTGFVADLLAARLAPATYALYLTRLREVYAALESAVHRHRSRPELHPVYDDRLLRLPAIDDDLRHWGRASSERGSERSAAVRAYVQRIRRCSDRPELLVGHHYTRYLGDLSGGRVLARRLEESFGSEGLAFYDFPLIERPAAYKRDYRGALDALPLDEPQRRRVVREVRAAFLLNRRLLDELGSGAGAPPAR